MIKDILQGQFTPQMPQVPQVPQMGMMDMYGQQNTGVRAALMGMMNGFRLPNA